MRSVVRNGSEQEWLRNKYLKEYAAVKNKYMIMRVRHDDMDELRETAKRHGISVNELVRTYITWGLEADDLAPKT